MVTLSTTRRLAGFVFTRNMAMPRSKLAELSPVAHGALDYAELARLGLKPDELNDFSANSNPYGPHPAVLAALADALQADRLARYPDRDCLALRAALAAVDETPPETILPGNGATELIHLIALAMVKPGSRQVVIGPTFGQYAHAIRLAGGEVIEYRPPVSTPPLRLEAEAVATALRRWQPAGVWLCNPNNPTGQQWNAAELAHLRAATPEAVWIVDESYRYFTAVPTPLTGWSGDENLILLRSLTKDQALAGLRLGYVIAALAVITALRAAQPTWSVNTLAQVAGVAALQPEVLAWRDDTLTSLHRHAAKLWAGLTEWGYPVLPTATPYALVQVADAARWRERLLFQGVQVRDCASFGLPQYARIAARRPEENKRLLSAVKNLVETKQF
ncbi:MAG: histidinol-phosphate aminotransferase family protein [Anaerolineae bacterium]|nr:histidinol-phosphate aminotransferase family protein [Anaerolineae bacterium]